MFWAMELGVESFFHFAPPHREALRFALCGGA